MKGTVHSWPSVILRRYVLGCCIGALTLTMGSPTAQGQQLLDDFNRPADNTVGGGWTEAETVVPTGARINAAGQLELGSTTQGRDYVSQDVSGFYGTTFGTNTCLLTWAFCVRQSRADPSGFALGNYGAAYVLGATTSNLNTVSNGYAIVFGESGATDPLRLVRFAGGLAGTQTPLIAGTGIAADLGASYYGVKVTYAPGTNTWTLYMANLTAVNFSTTDPTTIGTVVGTVVNNTYTATNLPFTGALWNHATGAGEAALFDNIHIPQSCIPTVTMATASSLAPEAVGTVTVNMPIFPASTTGGNVVVTMTNGPGALYGAGLDYTVSGAGVVVSGSDITITVGPGATLASFIITVNDDLLDEGNEIITFSITNTTGDLILGAAVTYVLTILDNDGLPAVNFTTLTITALESAGIQTFNLSLSPPAPSAGNITITITNGPGIVCGFGQDYQVTGFGCPPSFTIPVIAGQTSASFQITLFDDVGIVEVTETVTFTITGVPTGMTIGGANTALLNIADNDSPPTVLFAGDIVIVGINANNGGCPGGSTGEDFISFFSFKPIQLGTSIILTDNGWERCEANRWGNTEGTVLMTRTGPAIPAGQVITFRIANSSGSGNVIALTPDGGWTCSSLNGGTTFNLNVGGDQVFFLQGGVWTTNTVGGNNAQYTGNVLYGFTTNPSFPWSALCASPNGNQRSNLPPGMNCFSMAPTGASDFNKYVGPLTIATQRDWIIRLDNTANWSSPGSCAAYNALAPNWLAAPILPITPGGFTPGLWRGSATSQDWFDCKNWDDAQVPVATTNVRIDETANNNCIVGVTAGGNAVCASLVQTNSGLPRNLTIQNSSSLAVGGPMTCQRTSTGSPIFCTVLGNSTLTATSFTIQGTNFAEAWLRNEVPGNTVTFSGDLTIGTGGMVDLQGAAVGGRVFVGGNYNNAGPTEANLDELYGSLIFNGAGAQSISTGGFQEVMYNLTVDKPGGSLTLNTPLAVRNVLDLSNGRLFTSAPAGLLSLRAGSSWANATDASFVHGPMEKIGLTDFTFPVGKGTLLRPCRVEGITGAATNAFQAEYFPVSGWSFGLGREATIDHVSDCEHWTIDRSSGTPNAVVQLTWRAPVSCGVDNLAELRVARWDATGSIWRDRGNGGTTGTFINGTVRTAAQETLFSPWTLASTTANNPLPITLVHFTARPEGTMVRLEWTTASEQDNAFFSIERSQDGVEFEHVVDVPGALNSVISLNYTELDVRPYSGLSYYRLRQTDTGGTSSVSPMVAVNFQGGGKRPLLIFNDGGTLTALHEFPAGSRFALLDMVGRVIAEGSTTMEGRTEIIGLTLSRGAYLLRMLNGEQVESERFVY